MDYSSTGKLIREYRKAKNLSQEKLAELVGLSRNYIGMIERSEKTPSTDKLIDIANVLEIPSALLLADVINTGYKVKASLLTEKIEALSQDKRKIVFEVLETLIKNLQ